MDSIHTAGVGPQRKRRWYQFRLRTMLLAVIPLALGSAWLAAVLRRDDTVLPLSHDVRFTPVPAWEREDGRVLYMPCLPIQP